MPRSTGSGPTRPSPPRSLPCSAPRARRLSRAAGDAARGHGRRWLTAGAVALAISAVPLYLSERYVNDAYDEWRSDASRAYDDLDRAQALNPLSVFPVLAEGAIARANGDRPRAIDAFRRAAKKRPRGVGGPLQPGGALCPSSTARPELAIASG